MYDIKFNWMFKILLANHRASYICSRFGTFLIARMKTNLELGMLLGRLILVLCLLQSYCSLRIATYNIWNQMFNWKVRRLKIGEQIKYDKTDIISFQEVRGGFHSHSGNQLTELQSILPGRYRWSVYEPAHNVTPTKDAISNGYPCEGVGLISSLPVMETFIKPLRRDKHDPDRNRRIILHAVVREASGRLLNVLVLHLSYHKQQQCKNIADIISYIKEKNLRDIIIMGDLNTYKDYEDPVKLLTDGTTRHACTYVLRNYGQLGFEPLLDAWTNVHPNEPGLTFSNMPKPGLESRPDRVLVSRAMKVKSAIITGYGTDYKDNFWNTILLERFLTIAQSSYLSYSGIKGYPCMHDCGPRGSCKCGVCVRAGKDKGCSLPDCDICDKTMYGNLVFYTMLCAVVGLNLLYAIFAILIIGSSSYGEAVYSILGFSCCLMSKDLFFSSVQSYRRKFRILHACRLWPLFRLPPYLLLMLSLLSFLLIYFRVKTVFGPVFDLMYDIMEEELFTSDHRMLTVDVDL